MADDLDQFRNSFGAYYLALDPKHKYAEFQQERIVPALESVAAGDTRHLAVYLPPGHAKTTTISVAFTSWWLGRNPAESAMTLSYSADLAKDCGLKIKSIMQSPFHRALFPLSGLSRDSFASNRFRTVSGGNYFAVGIGGVVSGRRIGLMVLDDLIKNWQEAMSPASRESLFNDYKTIIRTRLTPTGSIIIGSTRWTTDDIYCRIMDLEPDEWEVLKIPAENPDGTFLWEGHIPKEDYLRAKKDERTWRALYMQSPEATDSEKWFRKDWLCYYDGDIKPGKLAAYMVVDPALSKRTTGDRTSIAIFLAGDGKRALLADWTLDRLDPHERTREIIRLVRKWSPRRFIYEEYGLMADTFHLAEEMKVANLHCYPVAVGRKGPRHMLSKESRIGELVPDFRDGKIVLPKTMMRKLVSGEEVDLIEYFINAEYEPYAGKDSTRHDDGLDTFSRLHEPELDFRYVDMVPKDDDEPSEYEGDWSGGGRSWQSLY